jgi:hypothetical protein
MAQPLSAGRPDRRSPRTRHCAHISQTGRCFRPLAFERGETALLRIEVRRDVNVLHMPVPLECLPQIPAVCAVADVAHQQRDPVLIAARPLRLPFAVITYAARGRAVAAATTPRRAGVSAPLGRGPAHGAPAPSAGTGAAHRTEMKKFQPSATVSFLSPCPFLENGEWLRRHTTGLARWAAHPAPALRLLCALGVVCVYICVYLCMCVRLRVHVRVRVFFMCVVCMCSCGVCAGTCLRVCLCVCARV